MARQSDDILEIFEVSLTVKLIDLGILEPGPAKIFAAEFFDEQKASYGGVRYMLKRGYHKFPPDIKREIAAAHDGKNRKKLCQQYGMAESTFYEIIKNYG